MSIPYRASRFNRFAKMASRISGMPVAFVLAASIIAVWAIAGPIVGFSEIWQMVINTATTIITFLMIFLIQNTQNRDSAAVQIKLDELIRAVEGAHYALLDIEELDDTQIERIRANYEALAAKARKDLMQGRPDTGVPEVNITQ